MKKFLSGLYHFIISIIMWVPCHPLRRLFCMAIMKHFDWRSAIYRNVDLRSPYRISVGKGSVINKNCVLDGRLGGVFIGDNVDIAQEVNIWTESHDYNNKQSIYGSVGGPVIIDDYVWIASRATILPGVKIGRGAVVASCSVVTKDVEPLSIVAGNPARVIGKRDSKALNYKLQCRSWFK